MSFVQGSRMGYLGTSYAALKKCGPLAGRSLIINGASGTLGVGATIFALAMGIRQNFCVAAVRSCWPGSRHWRRIGSRHFSNRAGSTADFVRARTGGAGADLMLDTLGAKAPLESMRDAMKAYGAAGASSTSRHGGRPTG